VLPAARKRRHLENVAELLVGCKASPFLGEPMSPGLRPGLADYRRVRFHLPAHKGEPRFRLTYPNDPTDRAPGEMPLADYRTLRR
jgi:hypothetical protein